MAKKKATPRKKQRRKVPSSDSILLDIVNEIDAIEALLGTFPEIEEAAQHFGNSLHDPYSLVNWARERHGIDLNIAVEESEAGVDSFPNLTDLPNAPGILIDIARWRLRRLSVLIPLLNKAPSG